MRRRFGLHQKEDVAFLRERLRTGGKGDDVAFPYSAGPAFTDIIKRMCGVLGGGRLELVGSGALSLNGDYPGRGDDFGPGVHVAPTLYFRSIEQRVKNSIFYFLSTPGITARRFLSPDLAAYNHFGSRIGSCRFHSSSCPFPSRRLVGPRRVD